MQNEVLLVLFCFAVKGMMYYPFNWHICMIQSPNICVGLKYAPVPLLTSG